MGFRLANVEGRAALVHGDHYCDLSTVGALGQAAELSTLASTLGEQEPTGFVADVVLGPPVRRPQKSFGIGLNYPDHAAEGPMEVKRRVEPRHVDCS